MIPATAKFGFHASHEQFAPSTLLEYVQLAERAGFRAGMCSDHFHPWSERQGHSGFAWSWLGAALQATNLSFGVVNAPGQRYHPAIIAQAAATLAEMFPGRFWIAVGSGEALNEQITGDSWPPKNERNDRLLECVHVMRALWAGETVNHDGLVRVRDAKLYSRPKQPPLLIGAAITADTAEWVGSWADGLITAGNDHASLRKTIEAFRAGGGEGKPAFLQSAISYAPTREEALAAAHDQWRHATLDESLILDLTTPAQFDSASKYVPAEELTKGLRISADVSQFIDWFHRDLELGYDTIYINHLGRDLRRFIDVFGEKVLPKFV
jgi:coenzyme F420-dependent glucose-6-phosphate dehydrogenase